MSAATEDSKAGWSIDWNKWANIATVATAVGALVLSIATALGSWREDDRTLRSDVASLQTSRDELRDWKTRIEDKLDRILFELRKP